MARGRISEHVRSNIIGYVALFVALGGTAWAANGPLAGRNTVGSADIINSEVRAPDIAANAVRAEDIKNAPSGSEAVNADLLDGFDSDEFAPAGDLHVSDRQKIDDETAGDLSSTDVPILTTGAVSFVGQCTKNQSLSNEDKAEILVLVSGTGNASVAGTTSNAGGIDSPTFGGGVVGGASAATGSTNAIAGLHLVVVAPDGQAVSANLSAEINDTDGGSTSDCAFAGTAVG